MLKHIFMVCEDLWLIRQALVWKTISGLIIPNTKRWPNSEIKYKNIAEIRADVSICKIGQYFLERMIECWF